MCEVHPQDMTCTPSQSKSQFVGHFLRGGLDVEVYLDRLLGATTIKRSSTFLKKVHPRQNPGYAYDSVEQSAISALHDNSLSLSTCGLRLKVCLFER